MRSPGVPTADAAMMEWIAQRIGEFGYAGVALLMFLETFLPPIPSVVVMPFAGFAAARGDLELIGVIVAGATGSVLGAIPWYLAGRRLGELRLKRLADRHGRWLTLSSAEVDRAMRWIRRHGRLAVFIGQLAPGLRAYISAPAGVARIGLAPFVAWAALGALVWTSLLAIAGYRLESRYGEVAQYADPIARIIFLGLIAAYAVRVWRYGRVRER
jgi:membrane protein DedA with SNARE-associated domain